MQETINCFGLLLFKRWAVQLIVRIAMGLQSEGSNGCKQYSDNFTSRVILSNSFYGLEEARSLPPNVHLTGPLVKNQGNLLKELEIKHNKLFQWLEEAQAIN